MAAIVLKDSRDYQGEAALAEITLAVFGLDGTIRIETAMYGPQEAGHWSLPGNNTPLFKRPSY